ncbi:MAG: hypothetical protein GHCLOJNM_04602 [bacterium]|nr:hypothetical protein [bacterium]
MSGLILAVDGGRSHLRAALMNRGGGELARVEGRGIPTDLASLESLLIDLVALPERLANLAKADPGAIRAAALGLAGFGRESECRVLEAWLVEACPGIDWFVESDAAQTLRAAKREGPVAIAILGTGSAFFARDAGGGIHRVGGWGPLLEDYGGGFEIGRQAILSAFRAQDGATPFTGLHTAVLDHAACREAPELLKRVYSEPPDPSWWASFAPLALEQAAKGDSAAASIVRAQVDGVRESLRVLLGKSKLPSEAAIYFTGGLVKGSASYWNALREALADKFEGRPLNLMEREAIWGGWLRAVEQLGVCE